MKKRNNRKRSSFFETLENRRLLAADFAAELLPPDLVPTETCEVCVVSTELPLAATPAGTELPVATAESEASESLELADTSDDVIALGDPVDGTDGFFGELTAENSSQSFSITPSAGGIVNVAVASSFGDGPSTLELNDAEGNLIASSTAEAVDGFQIISFEAEAGVGYELTVSTEGEATGFYQITSSHSADLHADEIGLQSTELEFTDGESTLTGALEEAGDVDTFRFEADSNGIARLHLAETDSSTATELQVRVFDAVGQQLTRGITNEEVGISFEVISGAEYFVEISAGEGQVGTFELGVELEAVAASEGAVVDTVDVAESSDLIDGIAAIDEVFEDTVEDALGDAIDDVLGEVAEADEAAVVEDLFDDAAEEVGAVLDEVAEADELTEEVAHRRRWCSSGRCR